MEALGLDELPLVAKLAILSGGGLAISAFLVRSMLQPLAVRGVPILRYRLVGQPLPGSRLNDLRIPVSRFEKQIRHLSGRGFRPVSLSEALKRRNQPAFLRENPICLTFDGPYESLASVAWPILQKYRLDTATLFFPPARLGQSSLQFAEGRPEPILSSTTLAQLTRMGLTLGVQAIPPQDDEQDAFLNTLLAGREALRPLSPTPIDMVALPYSDEETTRAARKAGFTGAVLMGDGILRSNTRPFRIGRHLVSPSSTLLDLALAIARRVDR